MNRAQRRGAATVEFAIAMLALVPLALYTIYVGELFSAAIKVQEIELNAAFSLTPYRYSRMEVDFPGDDLYDDASIDNDNATPSFGYSYQPGTYVPNELIARYSRVLARNATTVREGLGFEGYLNGKREVAGTARVADTTPRCTPFAVTQAPNGIDHLLLKSVPSSAGYYLHRGGYVRCQAELTYTNNFLPQTLFSEYSAVPSLLRRNALTFCGSGRDVRGCGGTSGVILLVNDWSLHQGSSHRGLEGGGNRAFYNVGNAVYYAYRGRGVGSARIIEAMSYFMSGGIDFANTSDFKLAYRTPISSAPRIDNGGLGPDRAHLTPYDDGQGPFEPGRRVHQQRRNNQYLGKRNARYNVGWTAQD